MNPTAILALISDLYLQITQLSQENAALKQRLAEAQNAAESTPKAPVKNDT